MKYKFLTISVLIAQAVMAVPTSRVIEAPENEPFVFVAADKLGNVALDEKVCLYRKSESGKYDRVVCGTVHEISGNNVKVKLMDPSKHVKVGDLAQLVKGDMNRATAAEPTPAAATPAAAAPAVSTPAEKPAEAKVDEKLDRDFGKSFSIDVGTLVGTTFYSYMGNIQYIVNGNVSIGVQPWYGTTKHLVTLVTSTWMAGLLTVNWYSEAPLKGLWLQLATGAASLTAVDTNGTTEASLSPVVLATIGWREKWTKYFHIGLAAGFQWVAAPQRPTLDIGFVPAQPCLSATIGTTF